MKHLANKEIFNILNDLEIENFTINGDGSVDVDGDVDIFNKNLTKIPVQFVHVTGSFNCSYNKLTTLEGSPKYVGKYFNCSNNQLINLKGCPTRVDDSFFCDNNKLTSLEGPAEVDGNFYCSINQLINLKGCPTNIGGYFYCRNNPLPQEIFDNYDHIKYIVEYQELYSIWRQDGSLDKFRFQEMMKDI